jgi:hypothetical protein
MPWLLTRIVPSELEALFTTAPEELLLVCAAGCVLAAELVVLLLVELLPQAASNTETAAAGRDSLSRWRNVFTPLDKSGTVLTHRVLLY